MKTLNKAARLTFEVSNLCFGTSALGDMPDTYGYSVDEDRARDTIRTLLSQPNCFIDTSGAIMALDAVKND